MHGWIVFIKKILRRGVRLGLVADCPQKAVQGIEPALIVNDEKDREAPRVSRPHNLTYLGNLTVLGLTVYRQTAVMSALGHSRPSHLTPMPINVRCCSNSDQILRRSEMTQCANR